MQRVDEKRELSQLNERFVQYVRRVRELKQESDISALYDSLQSLEEELRLLRVSYENQIAQLQASMEILSKEKIELDKRFHTKRSNEAHLLDRLQVETQKSEKLTVEILELRKESESKEDRIKKLQQTSSNWKAEYELLRGKYEECVEFIQDLQQKLRQEEELQNELQRKISALETKSQLSEKFFEETQADLRRQLEEYAQKIVELDKVLDSAGRREASLPEVIQQLKETAKQEFQQFQEEMESFYQENMRHLQSKLEDEQRKSKTLQKSVAELKDKLLSRQAAVSQSNAELAGLIQQRQLLEETLKRERQEANGCISSLEKKLRDLQELMVNKLTEAAAARHPEVTLASEIETLKDLLNEEERRLHMDDGSSRHPGKMESPLPYTMPLIVETKQDSQTDMDTHGELGSIFNENLKDPFYEQKNQLLSSLPSPQQALLDSQRLAPSSSVDSSVNGMDRHELMVNETIEDVSEYKVSKAEEKSPPKPTIKDVDKKSKRTPSLTANLKDANVLRSSLENSTGGSSTDLKFVEVNKDGQFIRIINGTEEKDIELGGYFIQVNFGNQPIAIFRFPPNTKLRPGQTATVWSLLGIKARVTELQHEFTMEECSRQLSRPPSDFSWPELEKWPTGVAYTTLLCRPDGQVVYWFTKNSRRSQTFFMNLSPSQKDFNSSQERTESVKLPDVRRPISAVVYGSALPSYSKASTDPKPTNKYWIMSEETVSSDNKSILPLTNKPTQEMTNPSRITSSRITQSASSSREKLNSSISEFSPAQSTFVKSELNIQESDRRISPGKKAPQQRKGAFNIRENIFPVSHLTGAIFNRGPEIFLRSGVEPPSPFSKPSLRVKQGVNQVISIQNTTHQPSLPKPPLFSEW